MYDRGQKVRSKVKYIAVVVKHSYFLPTLLWL